jgi:hypothetical protein
MEEFDPHAVVASLKAKAKSEAEVTDFEAAEKRAESERLDAIMREIGIPKRIRLTLGRSSRTRALELVETWSGKPDEAWALVLSADKGVGKSTAAGWWLAQVAKRLHLRMDGRATKRWWPAAEISALDFYGEDLQRLCEVESMVIDDLGVEFSDQRGAFQSKLDRLLDARYREFRRTLITTNLTPKAFRERYDQRLYDRLREGATWEGIVAQSMRGAS